MTKYRKMPVVIEATRCVNVMEMFNNQDGELPPWLVSAYIEGGFVLTDGGIYLYTSEGKILARPDDWIICDVDGEVYPCKPDIFENTYELAE